MAMFVIDRSAVCVWKGCRIGWQFLFVVAIYGFLCAWSCVAKVFERPILLTFPDFFFASSEMDVAV